MSPKRAGLKRKLRRSPRHHQSTGRSQAETQPEMDPVKRAKLVDNPLIEYCTADLHRLVVSPRPPGSPGSVTRRQFHRCDQPVSMDHDQLVEQGNSPVRSGHLISEIEMKYFAATELSTDLCDWVFDLFRRNMEQMYRESSWGFKKEPKLRELFNRNSKYIIASSDDQPVAFVHFRFERDNNTEVIYIYEIQIEPFARCKGLGRRLIELLVEMAVNSGMKKLMATVFRHNPASMSFFRKVGFAVDQTSPPAASYKILSLSCLPAAPVTLQEVVMAD